MGLKFLILMKNHVARGNISSQPKPDVPLPDPSTFDITDNMNHILRLYFPFFCISFSLVLSSCTPPTEEIVETVPEVLEEPQAQAGDFVTIPAGEFIMGSNTRPSHNKKKPALHEPEHTVNLPAFQIHVFEVTNAEYTRFQIEGDYPAEGDWQRYSGIDKGYHPVANVTWKDAKAYCDWIGGRLPTEAEWEKTARGPDGLPYPWGEEWSPTKSNCNELGYQNVVEVGQVETDVSVYGVRDMMGNVQEWVGGKLRAYPKSPARRDANFQRGFYSARGGSYAIKGASINLWTRGAYLPRGQYGTGFRCAKDVVEKAVEGEESLK